MGLPSLLKKTHIISQSATLYDPLGFITLFTLKAKLLMRDIAVEGEGGRQRGWDDPINEILYEKAKSLFKEMFLLEDLELRRCVKPLTAVGNPELVIFADGSNKAYGAVAYIRWELSNGSFSSHLLCSKNSITPIRQMIVSRLELCGAVGASRLRCIIEREMQFKFQRVIHVTDSSIVRAQIRKE